ncbi:hypothetical protein SMMN14_06900 [Sphaerulina musiva]
MQHASHWYAVDNCGRASQFILLHSDTSPKRSLMCHVAELRRSQTPRNFRSAVDSIGQVQRMIKDMPGPSGSFEAARTKPEPPHPGAIKATLVDPVEHRLPVESQP